METEGQRTWFMPSNEDDGSSKEWLQREKRWASPTLGKKHATQICFRFYMEMTRIKTPLLSEQDLLQFLDTQKGVYAELREGSSLVSSSSVSRCRNNEKRFVLKRGRQNEDE